MPRPKERTSPQDDDRWRNDKMTFGNYVLFYFDLFGDLISVFPEMHPPPKPYKMAEVRAEKSFPGNRESFSGCKESINERRYFFSILAISSFRRCTNSSGVRLEPIKRPNSSPLLFKISRVG